MNQTLEQKRSKYAFDEISKVKGKSFEKDFSSLISRLATLILTNGLGNTLAFLFAKGKNHHLQAIYILANWLINRSSIGKQDLKDLKENNVKEKQGEILKKLVLDVSVEEYIFYTEESLRLLNWLRRYSDAMLTKGDSNEDRQK
jgi:CRISPR-associated protein Cmr5